MIDVRETQDPQCERDRVAVDGRRADDEHPAWCSPAHCFVTDEGVRLRDQFRALLPLDIARRLRDQLTTHLDAAQLSCELGSSTATDPTEADTCPPVQLVAGADLDARVAR